MLPKKNRRKKTKRKNKLKNTDKKERIQRSFFIFVSAKHRKMENKEEILNLLNSENPEISADAIEKIKQEGDLTIVPALFDLLASGNNHRTTTEIVNLLADIKNSGFGPLLIQRIKNTRQPAVKSVLLRICWESSLDFSAYAGDFMKILQEDDFIVALEAATALENMDHIAPEKKAVFLSQLKQMCTTNEKQFLIDNILASWSCTEEDEEQ